MNMTRTTLISPARKRIADDEHAGCSRSTASATRFRGRPTTQGWAAVLVLSCITGLHAGAVDGPQAAGTPVADISEATAGKAALPVMRVHRSARCGCCGKWIEHIRQAGFPVEVHSADELASIKQRVGVPYGLGSCHTAEVGGYFIEGHVPAEDVVRLLAERPAAKGLAVPGMPLGSPGMEAARRETFRVLLIDRSGQESVFAEHGD